MEHRHRETFELFDLGKITLAEYLTRVVFHQKRSFTKLEFRKFMLEQSQPHPKMIRLMMKLKKDYGLKVVAVSNEAKELNAYRIATFKLNQLIDTFISSCYVGVRKPDMKIFDLAHDISQAKIQNVLYIENTAFFVELAERQGIQSILHTDYDSTCKKLASFGLQVKEKI
jgi:putative hydrolase of the HAD superfamily